MVNPYKTSKENGGRRYRHGVFFVATAILTTASVALSTQPSPVWSSFPSSRRCNSGGNSKDWYFERMKGLTGGSTGRYVPRTKSSSTSREATCQLVFEESTAKENDKPKLINSAGMTISLFATHFAVMAAKCSLPSCFALIVAEGSGLKFGGSPQRAMSTLLFLSTLAIAIGKILLGPVIDRFGGVVSLKALLCTLFALLGTIGTTTNFNVFAVSWILVDLCFSACWPGCLSSVHQSFQSHQWAGKVGMLAMAARTGNACAFLTFGSMLQLLRHRSGAWRYIFWLSAAIQLIPLFLLNYFGSYVGVKSCGIDALKEESRQKALSVLRKEISQIDFWLILLSRSALMIFGNFLLFVPTFMTHGYSLSHALSSNIGSLYAVGCLVAISLYAPIYNRFSLRKKMTLLGGMGLLSTCCALMQLFHVSVRPFSPVLGIICMILWGFSFSVPFYIPPALFALSRGGESSAATIG